MPGNVTPAAEANIWNDAEAAHAVLTAAWPLTLVPLDMTMQHVLTENDRQQLLDAGDKSLQARGKILDLYFDFYISKYDERLCGLQDQLAAILAVDGVRSTGDLTAGSLSVELTGSDRGRILFSTTPHATAVRVVTNTTEPVAPLLMSKLIAWRDAASLTH